MKKRLLAMFMAMAMAFSLLPTSVFAAGTTTSTDDGVEFTKTLIQGENGQPDRIKLEAWTTGSGSESKVYTPTDIIIVADQSGSMDESIDGKKKLAIMEEAIEVFVAEVKKFNDDSGKNDTYRLALVGFASDRNYGDNTEVLTLETTEKITNVTYEEIDRDAMDRNETYYVWSNGNLRQVEYSNYYSEWRVYGGYNSRELRDNETVYQRVETVTDGDIVTGVTYYDLFDETNSFDSDLLDSALVNVTGTTIGPNGKIGKAIAALDAEGATRVDLGLQIAEAIFDAQPAGTYTGANARDQLVLVITDGVPTTGTEFDNGVANAAVDASLGMKNDGAHVYSMYIGTPSTKSANFLRAVSSNYPQAESINEMGAQAASSYYSAHTNADEIAKVFEDIAYSVTANSPLDETSVVADTLTPYFRLTDGAVYGDQIEVYTVDKTASGWANEEVEFPTASVALSDNNKTIEVTGFNFAYHCVTDAPKVAGGSDYGKKLVIYIPITEDTAYCEANTYGGYLPTNDGATITDSDLAAPITAEGAMDDVTIRYSLNAAERVHHIGTDETYTTTLEEFLAQDKSSAGEDGVSVLQEAITKLPDGIKNAGVNMTYYIVDPGEEAGDPSASGTNDDKVLATLTVKADESVDVTDFSKWTLADGVDGEVSLTIPEGSNMAEKVLVLACRLTSINDKNPDTELVYSNLDLIITNVNGYVVYGEIDRNGALTVSEGAPGRLFGNTYTETVAEGEDSAVMTFTPNEGYEIASILKLTKDASGNDVRKDLYKDGALVAPANGETLSDGVFTAQVIGITTDTAYEVTTQPKTFTLTTKHDEGSTIRQGTTYTYHPSATLNVWFNNVAGYHITSLTVDGEDYTAAELLAMTKAELAEANITLTTADSYDSDGDPIKVITAGSVVVDRTDNHNVEVTSAKQIYKLTYIYYQQNADGSYTPLGNSWTETSYVPYGAPITSETPKYPDFRAGDVHALDGANHTLSQWYDRYESITNEFLDVVTIAETRMPAHDYDLNAFWAKNPDKTITPVSLLKALDQKQTEDWTFNFIAVFDGQSVWEGSVPFAAGKTRNTTTLDITLTDIQYNMFKAGDVIRVYERHQDDAYWNYDETVFIIGYEEGSQDGIVIRDTFLDSEVESIYYFNKRQPILDIDKTLISEDTAKIGEEVTWSITVKNLTDKEQTFTLTDVLTANGVEVDAEKVSVSVVGNSATAAGSNPVKWTIAANAEASFTASYTVSAAADDYGKKLENTATAKVGEYTISDTADGPTVENKQPALQVTKEVTSVGNQTGFDQNGIPEATVGDTITWTITVKNTGNVTVKDIDITDYINKESAKNVTLSSASIATLPVGESALVTATYNVLPEDAGTTIINSAVAKGTDGTNDVTGTDEAPEVDVKGFIVTYTDGVDDETVFADQTTSDLAYGVTTPGFDMDPKHAGIQPGHPHRTGYLFDGWNPVVADTVTADAVYEAQWTPVNSAVHVDKIVASVNGVIVENQNDIPTAKVGETITWTITVNNAANVDQTLRLEDILSHDDDHSKVAGAVTITGDNDSYPAIDDDGYISLKAVTAPETYTYTVTYEAQMSDAGADLFNTAILWDDTKTDPEKKDASHAEPVEVEPLLTIEKTDNLEKATVGQTVTYQITVTNNSAVTLENILVVDEKIDLRETISSLEAGKSVTLEKEYKIQESDAGVMTNTAKATVNDDTYEDTDKTNVEDPSIEMSKTVSASTAKVNDKLEYTITVKNTGNVDLTNVEITDTMSGANGTITVGDNDNVRHVKDKNKVVFTVNTLAKGAVETITYTYEVVVEDEGKTISNAVVSDVPDDTKDDDETTTTVDEPRVEMSKNVTHADGSNAVTAAKGDTLTYTITVKNTGNVDLTNVKIKDTMDRASGSIHFTGKENVTYTGGIFTVKALAKGATETISYTYTVLEGDMGNVIGNTVTSSIPDDTDDDDKTETTIDNPGIEVTKSVTLPEGQTTAKVGDILTYTVIVKNTGNTTLTDIVVKDPMMGDDKIIDSLVSGAFETITYPYEVKDADAGKTLPNKVTVTVPGGPTDTDETETPVDPIPNAPGLSVTKSVDKTFVKVGATLNYEIVVENTGDTTLYNVTLEDSIYEIEGSDIGTMEPGDKVTFTYSYTTTNAEVGNLKNTVVVTADDGTTATDSTDTTVKKPSKPNVNPPAPPALNTEDHYAYIVGYPDGNVKPDGNITRAEVATIFFRLLTDESRDAAWSTTNDYSDVRADQWFNNAISTLSNAGILNGYNDGTFRPNAPITRAEFAKIASSFFSHVDSEYQGLFPDVPASKWYAAYVEAASELGLITGYPDGTFRPEQNITRAEACTIVNRTIDRHPHEDQLHEDMIVWPDNPAPGEAGHQWYYEQIQEATNSHEYVMENAFENWTELLENRDWAAFEKMWSDSNSAPGGDVMK
ncbi:MAG: DUF11 domain-containing protein [Ruminiclostridium sp.]|nr:DUF11 domain-containing protein [Ruminiclostridium sp.]